MVFVVATAIQVGLEPRGLEPQAPLVWGVELVDGNAPDYELLVIAACDAVLRRMREDADNRP